MLRSRQFKYPVTFAGVLTALTVVIIAVIGTEVYRLAITAVIVEKEVASYSIASVIAAVSAAVINLIVIIVLDLFYRRLAVKLTNWENHRTQSQYERHLVFKVYLFEFANNYASLYFIAFFKQQDSGRAPLHQPPAHPGPRRASLLEC